MTETAEDYMQTTMIERIARGFDPLQILLFGSRARGDARADSDVDIVVVLPAVEDPVGTSTDIRYALSDAPFCMDIVVTTPEDLERRRHIPFDVLSFAVPEAVVLYERGEAR